MNRKFKDAFGNRFQFNPGAFNDDELELVKNLNKGKWTLLLIAPHESITAENAMMIVQLYGRKYDQLAGIHSAKNASLILTQRTPKDCKRNVFKKFIKSLSEIT